MVLTRCNRLGQESCCTESDRRDAKLVCAKLGIPHRTIDLSGLFHKSVINPFVDSYLNGETPSPCILCNEHLKFGALMKEAENLGASMLTTGHYARIEREKDGAAMLLRGVDKNKDQSYFLFPALKADILNRLQFPVGKFTKDEVREIARRRGLPVSEKHESQEVCFVPDDDYTAFIEEFRPSSLPGPGNFVSVDGKVLGRHRGSYAYTIGQRRGLRIGFGKRKYVVGLDAEKNEVVLGEDEDLLKKEMRIQGAIWSGGKCMWDRAEVRIRSTHPGAPARMEAETEGSVRVIFDQPQRAITPGQAAVFYEGDKVIGGGWIV